MFMLNEENKSKNQLKTSKIALQKNKFEPNTRYFTICIYGLIFTFFATLIVMSLFNWGNTWSLINGFLGSITPFIIAFFIAYVLNPLVCKIDHFLEKQIFKEHGIKTRKFLSICLTYLIVIAIITIILLYITPEIIHSIEEIQNTYSKVDVTNIEQSLIDVVEQLKRQFPNTDLNQIEDKINAFIPDLINFSTQFISSLVPYVLNLSVSVVRIIINFVLAIVISCYMLSDKRTLAKNAKRTVYALFPKQYANNLSHTIKECDSIFSSFIIGKSIDSLIIGCICFVAMRILNLPYSVLFSVIVGITNMIPYFGPFIGAIPGVLIYLFLNPIQALIFAIMIFILQQFDGLYLGPKILGESTGLTPLWVIFGITVGGAYGGVLGMFLGVPVIAVIAYLLDTWISNRLKKKNIEL